MIIVVGLGNFGKEYEKTYHNLGFMVADKLAFRLGVTFDKQKFKAKIAEGVYAGEKIIIAKPQTYMNNSGECLVLLKKMYKDARIFVAVDDIDLPAGQVRYRAHGSSGTHNGLRSIVQYIGEEFERVRIGTSRDEGMDLADFVLSKIKDMPIFDKATDDAVDIILAKIKENKN